MRFGLIYRMRQLSLTFWAVFENKSNWIYDWYHLDLLLLNLSINSNSFDFKTHDRLAISSPIVHVFVAFSVQPTTNNRLDCPPNSLRVSQNSAMFKHWRIRLCICYFETMSCVLRRHLKTSQSSQLTKTDLLRMCIDANAAVQTPRSFHQMNACDAHNRQALPMLRSIHAAMPGTRCAAMQRCSV